MGVQPPPALLEHDAYIDGLVGTVDAFATLCGETASSMWERQAEDIRIELSW